ncbi:MAG: hypothetical protein KGY54_13950 [Oleiphilaceae bacterium]|nr:hypothetical protein [Oleiphilaceae bacterium]
MEDPKTTIKTEPRKSLLVLFALAMYSVIVGSIILVGVGLGTGETQMASGAGLIMITVGVICFIFYALARRQTIKQKQKENPDRAPHPAQSPGSEGRNSAK